MDARRPFAPAHVLFARARSRPLWLATPWRAKLLTLVLSHPPAVLSSNASRCDRAQEYVKGYTQSADGRLPGFRKRTMTLRLMLGGAIAGMLSTAAGAMRLF